MTTKRHRDVIKNQSMPKALLIVYATIREIRSLVRCAFRSAKAWRGP